MYVVTILKNVLKGLKYFCSMDLSVGTVKLSSNDEISFIQHERQEKVSLIQLKSHLKIT